MAQQKVIALVGPTSSGKSALAVELAKKYDGEIISADSRQVYRGLNIGTGKITRREMRSVRHHLLDVSSPKTQFTAHDFVEQASAAIVDISSRGKLPIICGGTGFYIDALLGLIALPDVPANASLRARLEKKSAEQLFVMLQKRDPRHAGNIDRHNKRRLIRALEIAAVLGKIPDGRALGNQYVSLWLGLRPADDVLRKRINKRLKARLKNGMVTEAKRLHASGLSYKRMAGLGLEYRSLARFLQKKITHAELERELQLAIWHYAKRQMTYWRRNKNITWFKTEQTVRLNEVARTWMKKGF